MVEIHCIKNARNENSTFDLSWTLVFEWTVRCLQTVQFLVMFGQEKCSGGLKFDFGPKWEIQICLIVVFFCKSKYHNFSTKQNFGAFISLRKSIKKFNKATLPKIFFWSLCTYLCAYLPYVCLRFLPNY